MEIKFFTKGFWVNLGMKLFKNDFLLKSLCFILAIIIFICLIPNREYENETTRLTDSFIDKWEASWLFFSQLFSTFISVLILIRIVKNLIFYLQEREHYLIIITWVSVTGIILFLSCTTILGFILSTSLKPNCALSISKWYYYGYSLLIIIFFISFDYLAHKIKKFNYIFSKKHNHSECTECNEKHNDEYAKKKWAFIKQYNISVVISFVVVICMSFVVEIFFSKELAAGLSGGSSAVQLILAHLLFDSNNYKIQTI